MKNLSAAVIGVFLLVPEPSAHAQAIPRGMISLNPYMFAQQCKGINRFDMYQRDKANTCVTQACSQLTQVHLLVPNESGFLQCYVCEDARAVINTATNACELKTGRGVPPGPQGPPKRLN